MWWTIYIFDVKIAHNRTITYNRLITYSIFTRYSVSVSFHNVYFNQACDDRPQRRLWGDASTMTLVSKFQLQSEEFAIYTVI